MAPVERIAAGSEKANSLRLSPLFLAPLGLLGAFGLVMLALRIGAIIQSGCSSSDRLE